MNETRLSFKLIESKYLRFSLIIYIALNYLQYYILVKKICKFEEFYFLI